MTEGAQIGTSVLQVSAYDKDLGLNGEVCTCVFYLFSILKKICSTLPKKCVCFFVCFFVMLNHYCHATKHIVQSRTTVPPQRRLLFTVVMVVKGALLVQQAD